FKKNDDSFTLSNANYARQRLSVQPYYLLTKLPAQDSLQYLLIIPLVPENKDNMIAWVAAKSDFPEYGDIVEFELPKERLILGPAQVEARIDQNTQISRQLSLWDQRGSRVVRGNLMIIP